MQTTIRLEPRTKDRLDEFRQYKNESYDEIVQKVIVIAKACEMEPKLAKKVIKEIAQARERIKKGEYYTEEYVKKTLKL